MYRPWFLFLLICIGTATHAATSNQKKIDVYSNDMQTLLAKGNSSITLEDGLAIYQSNMFAADGRKIVQTETHYETASLKVVYMQQDISAPDGNYHTKLQLNNDGIYLYKIIDPKGKVTNKSMSYKPGGYMGVTILRRLEQHIPQLLAGEKIVIDIMVPDMERTFSFGFKLDGVKSLDGKNYPRIVMKAESWLVAAMAPDMSYLLDTENKTIIATIGPWGFNEGVTQSITLYH